MLQAHYSVPVRLVGAQAAVPLAAEHLEVLDGSTVVARHTRSPHKNTETLVLDNYLEILGRKPGALPGADRPGPSAYPGSFTDAHQGFWDACRRRHGDAAGSRALIEVLLAHRRLPAEAIHTALKAATAAGIYDSQAVTVEARRAADTREHAPVVPIGALARFDRPAPTLPATTGC